MEKPFHARFQELLQLRQPGTPCVVQPAQSDLVGQVQRHSLFGTEAIHRGILHRTRKLKDLLLQG